MRQTEVSEMVQTSEGARLQSVESVVGQVQPLQHPQTLEGVVLHLQTGQNGTNCQTTLLPQALWSPG